MSQIIGTALPNQAMRYLQVGRVVMVATVGEDGSPDTAPISWLLAVDPQTIRMAVSPDVSTYRNLLHNDRLMLAILGGGMTLGVKGRARLLADPIADLPFPMAMFEVVVSEVKDDSVLGRAGEGPVLRWEERRRAVSDHRVLAALQAGNSNPLGQGSWAAEVADGAVV